MTPTLTLIAKHPESLVFSDSRWFLREFDLRIENLVHALCSSAVYMNYTKSYITDTLFGMQYWPWNHSSKIMTVKHLMHYKTKHYANLTTQACISICYWLDKHVFLHRTDYNSSTFHQYILYCHLKLKVQCLNFRRIY